MEFHTFVTMILAFIIAHLFTFTENVLKNYFLIFDCALAALWAFPELWLAGATLCCCEWASHCGGVSCCGTQAIEHRNFSSCCTSTQ